MEWVDRRAHSVRPYAQLTLSLIFYLLSLIFYLPSMVNRSLSLSTGMPSSWALRSLEPAASPATT